jgi:hypothetical protein
MELQRKSKKTLLVRDNCAAHPDLDSLRNIQVQFLSANTTLLVQPTDMKPIKGLVPYIAQSWKSTFLEQFKKIYCHHLQQLRRSVHGLILYKQHSLFPTLGEQQVARPFRTALLTVALDTQT